MKVRDWKTADGVGADLGLSAVQEYSSELVIVRGGYQYYTDKWQGESGFFDQVYFADGQLENGKLKYESVNAPEHSVIEWNTAELESPAWVIRDSRAAQFFSYEVCGTDFLSLIYSLF